MMMNIKFQLPKPVEVHFCSTNANDPITFLATFDDGAVVIDAGKEYHGKAAIKEWSDRTYFGDHLRLEITNAVQDAKEIIVTAKSDGDYDKTGLPDPLYLYFHFFLENAKIKVLSITLAGEAKMTIENLIQVNQDLCTQCGLCVKVCRGTLGMGSNGPEVVNQLCIGCGHCVAVCPNGALNKIKAPLKNQVKIGKPLLHDPDTVARFIRSRRSIRNYQQKTVSRETIIQLIDIARYAPTACNSQGVCYHVVDDPDTLGRITAATVDWAEEEMRKGSTLAASPWAANTEAQIGAYRKNGTDVILRNAPCLIVAVASKDMMPLGRDNTHFSLSYVQLYASSFGLGTCWSGLFEYCVTEGYEPLLRLLNLPENSSVTGGLMVGYPLYSFNRLVDRNSLQITWQ